LYQRWTTSSQLITACPESHESTRAIKLVMKQQCVCCLTSSLTAGSIWLREKIDDYWDPPKKGSWEPRFCEDAEGALAKAASFAAPWQWPENVSGRCPRSTPLLFMRGLVLTKRVCLLLYSSSSSGVRQPRRSAACHQGPAYNTLVSSDPVRPLLMVS
jgi:hypothetical protein